MRKRGRRSIRWRAFHYASPRAYFVTICVQNRLCLLGAVQSGQVALSPAGAMVRSAWHEIPGRFHHVVLDSLIVMPNHVHGILRLRPPAAGEGLSSRATLGEVIHWWKAKTTATYARRVRTEGWPWFPTRLWQRNFYERVIRDDAELYRGRRYILLNPARWDEDPEHRP